MEEMDYEIKELTDKTEILQNKCDSLQAINESLLAKNHKLDSELELLRQELAELRQQQQHNTQQAGGDSIAVVSAQGLVQAQNIIGNGQMGQIQIVSSDTLEPVQQSVMQQQQHESKANKCIICGNSVHQQPKRKVPKQVRCESCIQAEQAAHQQQQLFVAQDGNCRVKHT